MMIVLLCGCCGEHPCIAIDYPPLNLTRKELDQLEELRDQTGLRGAALRAKWNERHFVGDNDGSHAWTAIQPGKSSSEFRDVVPDEYPGESLDLYYAVFELYEKGVKELSGPPGSRSPTSKYLPTSQNKDRIKHLMMIYQIIPWSKRPENQQPGAIPPVVFRKKKIAQPAMSF
jgi:hypothetical protein